MHPSSFHPLCHSFYVKSLPFQAKCDEFIINKAIMQYLSTQSFKIFSTFCIIPYCLHHQHYCRRIFSSILYPSSFQYDHTTLAYFPLIDLHITLIFQISPMFPNFLPCQPLTPHMFLGIFLFSAVTHDPSYLCQTKSFNSTVRSV